MGSYCCNKSRLLKFLKRETNENNPLSRSKIERKMGDNRLERKTFSKYVCDSREVIADGDTDSTLGHIVTINRGPETVYYYQPGDNELTEDELHILIDSIISLKCLPSKLKANISRKLLLQTNKYVEDGFPRESLESDQIADSTKPFVDVTILNKVINAVRSKRSLLFDYYQYSYLKERVIRDQKLTVFPQAILINDGYYYLFAYYPMKGERRMYRIDRMGNVCIADPIGEIPLEHRFNYAEHKTSNFGMYLGTLKEICLECDYSLANQLIDKFGDYTVVGKDEKSYTIKVKVEIGNTFYGWLCIFGGKIKIVAPAEEVAAFKEFLANLQ